MVLHFHLRASPLFLACYVCAAPWSWPVIFTPLSGLIILGLPASCASASMLKVPFTAIYKEFGSNEIFLAYYFEGGFSFAGMIIR